VKIRVSGGYRLPLLIASGIQTLAPTSRDLGFPTLRRQPLLSGVRLASGSLMSAEGSLVPGQLFIPGTFSLLLPSSQ
jgi:hypothetical protein